MADVFSVRLLAEPSVSGGPFWPYVVPGARRAIVKCMSIVWGHIEDSGLDAWFQDDAGTKLTRVSWDIVAIPLGVMPDFPRYGGSHIAWGSWVLEAGTQLGIQTESGTVDFYA